MNNPWIKRSLGGKILNHTKLKENKNTTYQNVQDSAKALLYGTSFCALHAFIRKRDIFLKTSPQGARGKKQTQNWRMK